MVGRARLFDQTARRALPLARLARITARPPFERILTKKP
jgi:hypothetical protein